MILKTIWTEITQTKKTLRMVLGIIMMHCFINVAFFIHFWFSLEFGDKTFYFIGLMGFYFLWLPNIMLIVLLYILLTRVYPYEQDQ